MAQTATETLAPFKDELDHYEYEKRKQETCKSCGHSLHDNSHGPDQNDFIYDSKLDKWIHRGVCTYCKLCRGVRNATK